MARPRKKGIEYFPFDVDFFSDKKIKVLKSRFGADGITIYIYLLCEIYKNGYYIQMDDDYEYIIADDLGMSNEKVKQVMKFLLERSLLDGTLFQSDTIITSLGIQRRFQEAVRSRASKSGVEVEEKYWLLEESETQPFIKCTQNVGYSEKNSNYSEKNPSYSKKNGTKKSKVKESKVKENKNIYTRVCVNRFNDFFSAYPKKVNIQAAEKEYMLILYNNQALTEEDLIASARNYAEDVSILKTEEKFVKNPDRFLRDGRYFDYLDMNYKRPIKESKYGRELEEWMNE